MLGCETLVRNPNWAEIKYTLRKLSLDINCWNTNRKVVGIYFNNNPTKIYTLPYWFHGTNHVIFDGALFYHRADTQNIVRYDLYKNTTTETVLQGADCRSNYLYDDNSMSYFDFAADENGLWVLYRFKNKSFLSISKLHPKTLRVLNTWNLTDVNANDIGNAWITSGTVYVVKNANVKHTQAYPVYNLYSGKYTSMAYSMNWTNVYERTSTVTYNPNDNKVYVYNYGFLIYVPVTLQHEGF